MKLKDKHGDLLYKGRRKTFIVGFLTQAKSILAISKDLLSRVMNAYQYVLTYRFSQDALEMFFSKIRGRFEWNNNPNVLQLKYAIRALLLKNKIDAPNTANCINTEETSTESTADDVFAYDQSAGNNQMPDPVVCHLLKTSTNLNYDAIYYISGYIAKKMVGIMECPECATAFCEPFSFRDCIFGNKSTLLSFKAYGNLFSIILIS